MLKRLTAILVMLAMLFGMCAVVSADAADPYEYLPRDITIVCNKNDNSGVVVAWKNPTSSALSKVTVTDAGNGAVIGTIENPAPGGISRVASETASVEYGMFKAKFLFEFSNGEKREFYYTQDKRNYNLIELYTPDTVAFTGLNDYNVFTTNSQNTTENGRNSMMIVSNINPEVNAASAQMFFNFKGAESFPTVGSLKANTTYNFEYKVKTDSDITLTNYINSNGGTMQNGTSTASISASAEWQTVSGSFKTVESGIHGWMWFTISFKQSTNEPFYIDDVKITELGENGEPYTGTDTTSYTYDFEKDVESQPAKPTNVMASASDGMATLAFKRDNTSVKYINIYEVIDGKRILRGRMNGEDTSVDIPYLTNGKTYKFALTAATYEGIESEAEEVEVTPQVSVISKYKYEPGNLMFTDWRNIGENSKHQGYMISWINPTSEMESVRLYEINEDGTETEKVPNRVFEPGKRNDYPKTNLPITTPGAVVRFENQGLDKSSGAAMYRIVFNFADGTTRDVLYSGTWLGQSSGFQLVQESGKVISAYPGYEVGSVPIKKNDGSNQTNYSLTGPNGLKVSSKKVKGSAQYSFELTSNQSEMTARKQPIEFQMGQDMVSGTSYNFSMDINTVEAGILLLDSKTEISIPNTNGEWQTITGKFTSDGSNKNFSIMTVMAMREVYIDNIRIYSDDKSVDTTYSFSDISVSRPEKMTGVSATQGEKNTTTISWETAASNFVNIYEDIDENENDEIHTWMLRARVASDKKSVTLNNLETDMTHNFMCTTERETDARNYHGLESDGVFCSATLVMPDYEIEDVYMLAGGEQIEKLIPGNTYTAQAKILNAKCAEGLKAQVIVAVYADGVLDSFAVSDLKTIAVDNTETVTVPSFTIGNDTNKKYTAKIMVWKGLSSATPLINGSVPYTE